MNPAKYFNKQQKEAILKAIREAEKRTSGEIRVHIENSCKGDPLVRAMFLFQKLKMHLTEQRNGVIIYLALKNRKFAIFGDKGINERVPENFWQDVRDLMAEHFRKGDFVHGLTAGIALIGEKLREFFPYQEDDINELPDDISFGE